jgi:hypothetical protein
MRFSLMQGNYLAQARLNVINGLAKITRAATQRAARIAC